MPGFEFTVAGPPATVNTKDNNARRYQRWIREVRQAAQKGWPSDAAALDQDGITVSVTNYYRITPDRPRPPDVDNVLKPILDGMNGVVYLDDQQVFRVVSDRFRLDEETPTSPPLLVDALARNSEVLFIRVRWEGDIE